MIMLPTKFRRGRRLREMSFVRKKGDFPLGWENKNSSILVEFEDTI